MPSIISNASSPIQPPILTIDNHKPDINTLNNVITIIATDHPEAYDILLSILDRHGENQLKAILQGKTIDPFPSDIEKFVLLLPPALREQLSILSSREVYTQLSSIVNPRIQPSQGIKENIQHLATHHTSDVHPIRTLYQQLIAWVAL